VSWARNRKSTIDCIAAGSVSEQGDRLSNERNDVDSSVCRDAVQYREWDHILALRQQTVFI
jgi:hypothetical protein